MLAPEGGGTSLTFVTIYLIAYFALLGGAALALWQSGILAEIPRLWIAVGTFVAIGIGIVLAVASNTGAIRTRVHDR
jgi:hypothetical protein